MSMATKEMFHKMFIGFASHWQAVLVKHEIGMIFFILLHGKLRLSVVEIDMF